jgi:hypothetical protein
LAYQLVGQEVFKAKATAFVNEHLNFKNTNVAQIKINPKTYEVKVFLIGDHIPKSELDTISIRLNTEGLEKAKLKVYQNGEREDVDVSTLKADIITDLYQNTKADLQAKEKEIARLKEEMSLLLRNRDYYSAIPNELETLFPKVDNVVLSQNYDETAVERNVSENRLILNADTRKRLTRGEREKIEKWLKMRTKSDNVKIILH